MANVKITGGDKLAKAIAKARNISKAKGYDVGVFSGSTYPDGTPVAYVAAIQEYGAGDTPERAPIRTADISVRDKLADIIVSDLEGEDGAITDRTVMKLGAAHVDEIKGKITSIRTPPNDESTLEEKAPKSNPLINSGLFLRSITYRTR